MRALAAAAALAVFAVSTADAGFRLTAAGSRLTAAGLRLPASGLRLPASGLRLPAPGFRLTAAGAVTGRVDVRVGPSADVRPDPAGLGLSVNRDVQDRRRSVVYFETAPRAAFDVGERRHARMDQRSERFVPHVLAITAGSYVDFPNDDKTYHNVFSLSKTKEFNLGRYAAGHSESVLFDQPGIVRVFCEIHSHMSAFILVFAHRYFAVTGEDGRYRIENVPPGTYTMTVWNEAIRGDAPKRTVTVGESGGEIAADFSIR